MIGAVPCSQDLDAPAGGLRDFVDRALASLASSRGVGIVRIPTLVRPPFALLAREPAGSAFAWAPPDGPVFVGLGETVRFDLGPGGLGELRDRMQACLADARVIEAPGARSVAPRLFGGVAFEPSRAPEEPWTEHGRGSFVLPRWTYACERGRATLSMAALPERDCTPRGRAHVARELATLLPALQRAPTAAPDHAAKPVLDELPTSRWTDMVASALADIEQGRCRKIVVARCTQATASHPVDVVAALERLRAARPASTVFAVRRGGAFFLGATPELLVSKCAADVRSEALAGTADASQPDAERALLESRKDLSEHRVVVAAIVGALAPLCDSLVVAPEPVPRRLADVLHLSTPVSGRLRTATHVLDLVERLHPTPAVCGQPTDDARAWIARHEPAPRGWYAGPVGWVDGSGDGELVVALRCALVRGDRAWCYAGAGIVAGSDPSAEHRETAWKLRTVLGALGASA